MSNCLLHGETPVIGGSTTCRFTSIRNEVGNGDRNAMSFESEWRMKFLNLLVASACFGAGQASALDVVDWTSATRGVLGPITVNLSVLGSPPSNPTLFGGPIVSGTFGTSFFSGPVSLTEAVEVYGKTSGPTNTYTVAFSAPVADVRVHLGSLASAVTFNQTVIKLSGQSTFAASGATVTGAVDNTGLPTDSNGTVRLPGTLSSFSFTTRGLPGAGLADGIGMQIAATGVINTPAIYGVFVGVNSTAKIGGIEIPLVTGVKGVDDAYSMYAAFNSLPGFREGIVLPSYINDQGVAVGRIRAEIDLLKTKMKPGDKLVLFASGHGGSDATGGVETTKTPGAEFFDNMGDRGNGDLLTDDILADILRGFDKSIEKWVLLDSCKSGGFWGNFNLDDDGDLEKLENIALFASSKEDSFSYSNLDGAGYFSTALAKGLSFDALRGRRFADADSDGNVTFDELVSYVENISLVDREAYEKASGDLVLFSPDMYNPTAFDSPDFQGSLVGVSAVPEPPTFLLFLASLTAVALVRGRLKLRGIAEQLFQPLACIPNCSAARTLKPSTSAQWGWRAGSSRGTALARGQL